MGFWSEWFGGDHKKHANDVEAQLPLLPKATEPSSHFIATVVDQFHLGSQFGVNLLSTSLPICLAIASHLCDHQQDKSNNDVIPFAWDWKWGLAIGVGVFSGLVEAISHYNEARSIANLHSLHNDLDEKKDEHLTQDQKIRIGVAWFCDTLNDANDLALASFAFIAMNNLEFSWIAQAEMYAIAGLLSGLGNIQEAKNNRLAQEEDNDQVEHQEKNCTTSMLIKAQYLKNFIRGSKTGCLLYLPASFIADFLNLETKFFGISVVGGVSAFVIGALGGLATAKTGEVVTDFVLRTGNKKTSRACKHIILAALLAGMHFCANNFNDSSPFVLMINKVLGAHTDNASLLAIGANITLFGAVGVMIAGNMAQLSKDWINYHNNQASNPGVPAYN